MKPRQVEIHYNVEIDYSKRITPEQAMVKAVVQRAIIDSYGGCSSEQVRVAREWILDNEDNDDENENVLFTFAWCCSILYLDPNKVRVFLKGREGRLRNVRKTKRLGSIPSLLDRA